MTRPAAESETETGGWRAGGQWGWKLGVGGRGENWQPIGKSEKFTLPALWGMAERGSSPIRIVWKGVWNGKSVCVRWGECLITFTHEGRVYKGGHWMPPRTCSGGSWLPDGYGVWQAWLLPGGAGFHGDLLLATSPNSGITFIVYSEENFWKYSNTAYT